MTKQDEILNIMIVAVITVAAGIIFVLILKVRQWYIIYKVNKYVKEENERAEAEKAEGTGRFNAGRGQW